MFRYLLYYVVAYLVWATDFGVHKDKTEEKSTLIYIIVEMLLAVHINKKKFTYTEGNTIYGGKFS